MSQGYRGAGVYVFRTRRPGLIGRVFPQVVIALTAAACIGLWIWGYAWWLGMALLIFSPRHFAYVGESRNVRLRRRDHLEGSVKFNQMPKPWADLDPSWYFIPLPWAPKPVLRAVETVLILLLWPVYNHQKNLSNPRRIPLKAAKRQAVLRAGVGWSFNFRPAHAILWVALAGYVWMNRGVL